MTTKTRTRCRTNYPSVPLEVAIDSVETLYERFGRTGDTRDNVAKALGYKNYSSGASRIAALVAYGLLAYVGKDEIVVTVRGEILADSDEPPVIKSAVIEATFAPSIFRSIAMATRIMTGAEPRLSMARSAVEKFLSSQNIASPASGRIATVYLQTIRHAKNYAPLAFTNYVSNMSDASVVKPPVIDEPEQEQEEAPTPLVIKVPTPSAGAKLKPELPKTKWETPPWVPGAEIQAVSRLSPRPWPCTATFNIKGGISLSGDLNTPEELDKLIAVLTALKPLMGNNA